VPLRETHGRSHRHREGRRPAAIQMTVWIAASRSSSNDGSGRNWRISNVNSVAYHENSS
jgi:hypothetical protein